SVQNRSFSQNVLQSVSLNHGRIGKGTSDSQQQSRYGKNCDGKHETSADSLQYSENLVFHCFSSFLFSGTFFPANTSTAAHLDSASLHLGRGLPPYTFLEMPAGKRAFRRHFQEGARLGAFAQKNSIN